MKKLKEYVRGIPGFPESGIISRDVTSTLQGVDGLHVTVDNLTDMVKDLNYDLVIGPKSKGFVSGVPMTYAQHEGFVPVRKKGKLPRETTSTEYDLEYGQAAVEMHKDATHPSQKVIVVGDLIATGGTTGVIVKLIEQLGGQVVKIRFVMELAGLKERGYLKGYDVDSAITYEDK